VSRLRAWVQGDLALSMLRGTSPYSAKQGQYLAFIFYYTKIHGFAPSEADLQRYFQVSPPTVHQMILNLEKLGFIKRTPGRGRSLKLLLPREELPDLA
jgi:DNA-binding MarR family transcriptional regulator